jgi:hypothetical protein
MNFRFWILNNKLGAMNFGQFKIQNLKLKEMTAKCFTNWLKAEIFITVGKRSATCGKQSNKQLPERQNFIEILPFRQRAGGDLCRCLNYDFNMIKLIIKIMWKSWDCRDGACTVSTMERLPPKERTMNN